MSQSPGTPDSFSRGNKFYWIHSIEGIDQRLEKGWDWHLASLYNGEYSAKEFAKHLEDIAAANEEFGPLYLTISEDCDEPQRIAAYYHKPFTAEEIDMLKARRVELLTANESRDRKIIHAYLDLVRRRSQWTAKEVAKLTEMKESK